MIPSRSVSGYKGHPFALFVIPLMVPFPCFQGVFRAVLLLCPEITRRPGGRCRTPSLERPIHRFYHPSRIAPAQAHAYPGDPRGEGGGHPSPVPASKRGLRRHLDRLREIQSYPQPSPLYYTDGEEHLFLGTYYRLQLVVCGVKKNFLASDEKIGQSVVTGRSQLIQLRVDSDDPETVHKQLFLWYKTQIQKHIAYRLAELCPRIPWLAAVPTWRVRTMRRRWGSCTGSGVITLNTHLIKAPPQCLDYVLLHEIAHLQEHNHSQRYYAVLERLLPNWKAVRKELEAWSPLVLN